MEDRVKYVLPLPMSFHPGLPGRPAGVLLRAFPGDCPFMVGQDVHLVFDRLSRSHEIVAETIISSWSSSLHGTPRLIGRVLVTG